MSPRVSVVVPAYQNVAYIGATVESVLAQTYQDFELVVADHSSDDGTWELLQRYADDSRVRLLRTPAGGGAKRNWDRVSQAASGELIKLLPGDDLLYPDCLARQVEALDLVGPSATMATCRRDLVDARGAIFIRGRGLGSLVGTVDGAVALRATVRSGANPLGEPGCTLMRRDALERTGWWDDEPPFYIDLATYANLLLVGQLVVVDATLAAFRVNAGQWSVRLARQHASQAALFHARLHDRVPEVVRSEDVLVGNLNARLASAKRRAAYAVLGRRLRVA